MSIAQHAARILAAWHVADPEQFETALESALHCCRKNTGNNCLEVEQQELLETIVERLRSAGREAGMCKRFTSTQSLGAGFALLQHLSHKAAA